MKYNDPQAFKLLAENLAFNMVSCSFPFSYPIPFDEVLESNVEHKERSRNILIIGAGASKNLCSGIPLADEFSKIMEKTFAKCYNREFNETIISREIDRLANVYKLSRNEFETQLSAYSRFNKDLVLETLTDAYDLRYPVSVFYEVVAHLFKHRFIDVIINFNFDEILDNAIEEEMAEGEYKFIYSDGHCPEKGHEDSLIKSGRLKSPVYIKPHGTISHASTLRFTRDDYYHLPSRITGLLEFLFKGRTDDQLRNLPINLMVVGFGMNSLELNRIINENVDGEKVRLFYFDFFKSDKVEQIRASSDDKFHSFSKDRICLFDISGDDPDTSLNDRFVLLWKSMTSLYKPGYRPKNISRHIVVAEIFNPIAYKLLLSNNNKGEQKRNIRDYLKDRMIVELSLEILNCNDGILNLTHIQQGRVGKYFSLLRSQDKDTPMLYSYISDFGLKRYKEGVNDTWLLEVSNESKKKIKEKMFESLPDNTRAYLRSNNSIYFKQAINDILAKEGKFLNIVPTFMDNRISIFEKITEDDLINTDMKWIYLFKKSFYDASELDKWDLVLSVSENGSVFSEPRIVKALQNKKIVLICSYNSNEGRQKKWENLVGNRLKEISSSFLYDDRNEPVLKMLPMRSHNQHVVLFCKIHNDSILPVNGIYYQRRLMARKVSPLYIRHASDLNSLKSIFFTYYERADKESYVDLIESKLNQLTSLNSSRQIGESLESVQKILTDLRRERNTEQELIDIFRRQV